MEPVRFGKLVMLRSEREGRITHWWVRCDCGTEKRVRRNNVVHGDTRSCGCQKRERSTRHGLSLAPEYRSWEAMMGRCHNPMDAHYSDYGGRGIRVCERWHDVRNFIADMGEKPSQKHSIDRYPDNDGGYEPGNCRWATMKEQSNNRRRPKGRRLLTWHGKTQSLTRWAEEIGIKRECLAHRLNKGWSVEKALSRVVA